MLALSAVCQEFQIPFDECTILPIERHLQKIVHRLARSQAIVSRFSGLFVCIPSLLSMASRKRYLMYAKSQ